MPRKAPNRALEGYFPEVLELGPERLETELWRHILARFWSWAQKCSKSSFGQRKASNRAQEKYFSWISPLGTERFKIELWRHMLPRFWSDISGGGGAGAPPRSWPGRVLRDPQRLEDCRASLSVARWHWQARLRSP